jgi:hypothetical protein
MEAPNLDSSLFTKLASFNHAEASAYIENIPQALEWNIYYVVFKNKIGQVSLKYDYCKFTISS